MSAMVQIFSWGERWNVPFNDSTDLKEKNIEKQFWRKQNIINKPRVPLYAGLRGRLHHTKRTHHACCICPA